MRRIRLLFAVLVVFFGLTTLDARAQSARQAMTFSLLAEYQDQTNSAPGVTNEFGHQIVFTTGNIMKAILLDLKGHSWTNWLASGAELQRQVNLTNGEEGIYISLGGMEELNVSSFFGDTYLDNFTAGDADFLGFATNNFTYSTDDSTNELQSPFLPIYNNTIAGTVTNNRSLGGLHFISVTTTNLKLNLVGATFQGMGNGVITMFDGTYQKTNHYSVPVQRDVMYVVGSFSWNESTNFYSSITNVTNVFYSGPVRGTVTLGTPGYSPDTPVP